MIVELLSVLALQSTVPSPDYAAEIEQIARLSTAMGACDRAGFRPLPEVGSRIASETELRLQGRGLPNDRVQGLLSDALAVERARIGRVLQFPEGGSNEESRRVGTASRSFLFERCAEAKGRFPEAFAPSEAEAKYFLGWVGVWLDYPLVEEAAFFMTARGACAAYLPAFDATESAEQLARPFEGEPEAALADVKGYFVTSYRHGLDMASDLDDTQCRRLMATATEALNKSWSGHFRGSLPYPPF